MQAIAEIINVFNKKQKAIPFDKTFETAIVPDTEIRPGLRLNYL